MDAELDHRRAVRGRFAGIGGRPLTRVRGFLSVRIRCACLGTLGARECDRCSNRGAPDEVCGAGALAGELLGAQERARRRADSHCRRLQADRRLCSVARGRRPGQGGIDAELVLGPELDGSPLWQLAQIAVVPRGVTAWEKANAAAVVGREHSDARAHGVLEIPLRCRRPTRQQRPARTRNSARVWRRRRPRIFWESDARRRHGRCDGRVGRECRGRRSRVPACGGCDEQRDPYRHPETTIPTSSHARTLVFGGG